MKLDAKIVKKDTLELELMKLNHGSVKSVRQRQTTAINVLIQRLALSVRMIISNYGKMENADAQVGRDQLLILEQESVLVIEDIS